MYTKQGMYWIVLLSEVTLIIVSGSLIVTVDFAFPFTSFVAFFYVFQYFRFVNVIYSDNNFWLLFRWLILFYFLYKALYIVNMYSENIIFIFVISHLFFLCNLRFSYFWYVWKGSNIFLSFFCNFDYLLIWICIVPILKIYLVFTIYVVLGYKVLLLPNFFYFISFLFPFPN